MNEPIKPVQPTPKTSRFTTGSDEKRPRSGPKKKAKGKALPRPSDDDGVPHKIDEYV